MVVNLQWPNCEKFHVEANEYWAGYWHSCYDYNKGTDHSYCSSVFKWYSPKTKGDKCRRSKKKGGIYVGDALIDNRYYTIIVLDIYKSFFTEWIMLVMLSGDRQHYGCRCPGTEASSHRHPQCWPNPNSLITTGAGMATSNIIIFKTCHFLDSSAPRKCSRNRVRVRVRKLYSNWDNVYNITLALIWNECWQVADKSMHSVKFLSNACNKSYVQGNGCMKITATTSEY